MGIGRLSDGLAPTPPMGWNSWNRFGIKVDESLVLETAEALVASGMRDLGYRTVVIDDGWMASERDAEGDLVADPAKFPRGIADLARRVHALGLGLGIYTDAGTKTCQGLPASLGYEFRDARRFAEWGVDYLKVDWCHTDGLSARALYAKWALALHAAGRPIVFSICEWGRARPWEWAPVLGHLWRTCWDIQPDWSSLTTIVDRQAELHSYAGPDHWNDPDMLEIGNGSLTPAECRTHLALWAILAAPLMAGNDVRAMSDDVRDILTAPEVIAVDQDARGRQGRRIRQDTETAVWARDLADGRVAVALTNLSPASREVHAVLTDFGISGPARTRDLWQRADLGLVRDAIARTVAPHDTALLTLELQTSK